MLDAVNFVSQNFEGAKYILTYFAVYINVSNHEHFVFLLLSLFPGATFTTYKFKLFRLSCKLRSLNTKTIYNGI